MLRRRRRIWMPVPSPRFDGVYGGARSRTRQNGLRPPLESKSRCSIITSTFAKRRRLHTSIAAALRRRCFGYALGVGKRPYERNQSCIKSAKRFRPPLNALPSHGAYPTHSTPPPSLRCVIWRRVPSLRDDGPYGGAISRPRIVRIAPDPPFGALCNAPPQRCSKSLHRFRTGRRAWVGAIRVSDTCPGMPCLCGEYSSLV